MVSPPEPMPRDGVLFGYAGCDSGEGSLKELLAGSHDALLQVTG